MAILYGIILALFYGVIGAGQILGFAGYYRPLPAVALSLLLALLAAVLYFRENPVGPDDFPIAMPRGGSAGERLFAVLETVFAISAGLLFLLLAALPTLRWPASPLGRSLTWDAGAYHFPKAVELFRSGSVWDLSVAYGDYPFGYESLLAFGLSLTGDERLFGLIHMLIALFFCLVVWRLACRYSRLPSGFLLFMSVVLLVFGVLPGGGRAWLISGYAFTIGKNDFLLGALTLAVILHGPVGARGKQGSQPFSLALTSMMALAVKPNAAAVVGVMGLLVLYDAFWRGRKRTGAGEHAPPHAPWYVFVLAFMVALPGVLWAVRNLAALGVIFTPAAAHLQAESIASNLGNPYLYTPNFQFLLLPGVLGLLLAAIISLRFTGNLSPRIVGIFALLFIAFTITPASAFHRRLDVPSHIAWRFGVALLAYSALALLLIVDNPLQRFFLAIKNRAGLLAKGTLAAVILLTAVMAWRGAWIVRYEPQNSWILVDQFSEPLGVDDYWSAYDFVQQEIRHSVIQVENGLLYYLYGPGYTNRPTRLQYPLEMADRVPQPVPQYYVIFRPDWQADDPQSGEFPDSLEQDGWKERWSLIYDDGEGRVYQAISE